MQSKPTGWDSVFSGNHKTEYKVVCGGVTYREADFRDTPVITKPMLDTLAIGRVCTGSLDLKIDPGVHTIPKAAQVQVYCRLVGKGGFAQETDWLPQGVYYIHKREGQKVLTLSCLDGMIKAGTTYRDKSAWASEPQWPQSMRSVVADIASIMSVSLDSRTLALIPQGTDYVVSYPNDDELMSEVLAKIGAACGGNWIMNESGELRLVILPSAWNFAVQDISKAHGGYTTTGRSRVVQRVCLIDSAQNDFIAGDNVLSQGDPYGIELVANCDYATQNIANALCLSSYGTLYNKRHDPYSVKTAYIDPALELGDIILCTDRNNTVHSCVVMSERILCSIAYTADISAGTDENEEEYPYLTMRELEAQRAVRTDQTYFGNRINRKEGFVSELLVGGVVKGRTIANGSTFKMQALRSNGHGDFIMKDCVYFETDPITYEGKYVFEEDVELKGAVKFGNLTDGTTMISGDNIRTGTVKASHIELAGNMEVKQQSGGNIGGHVGYTTSANDSLQGGIAISALNGTTYTYDDPYTAVIGSGATGQVIATQNGAKLSYGQAGAGYNTEIALTGTNAQIKLTNQVGVAVGKYTGQAGGTMRPFSNGYVDLGLSGYAWNNLWTTSPAFTGSDRNKKEAIDYDISSMAAFFDALRPCKFRYKDGTSGRTHYGMIAQDVEDNLTAHGMTGTDFAGYGKGTDEETGEEHYSLRYEEFIALCIDQIQRLKARVLSLEGSSASNESNPKGSEA